LLWIGKKGKNNNLFFNNLILDGNAKFTATAQQIQSVNGKEENRQELESEKDGTRQLLKYEKDDNLAFVRFNITFL